MATYSYCCPKCKEVFDVNRKMQDRDKPYNCPQCNVSCKKEISVSEVHFKGKWTPKFYTRGQKR